MSVARRLVAIFYADVAGYSRLTGADEEGTHRRVMAVLDEASAAIKDAGGTVLRYAGDAAAAAPTVKEILKRDPAFSASANVAGLCYARDEDRSHHREALIAAGLPG